jgi:excisionase family DNA binding protein
MVPLQVKERVQMEQFMTSEEIAELLHVDPVTIRRLVNKGELSAYRIGADYRFAPSDLRDYLQRQRIAAHAQKESGADSSNPLDQFAQVLRKIVQGKHTTPSELVGRFDRFTKRARHVLILAQEEAQRFQHTYIGTEHLLLGLIREEEGVASQVLRNLGIEVDQVRQAIEAIIGRGERIVLGEVGLTPRAKKVMEFAVDEARRLMHQFIGTPRRRRNCGWGFRELRSPPGAGTNRNASGASGKAARARRDICHSIRTIRSINTACRRRARASLHLLWSTLPWLLPLLLQLWSTVDP